MSATTAAWLVLAAPLLGTILIGTLFNRLPGLGGQIDMGVAIALVAMA